MNGEKQNLINRSQDVSTCEILQQGDGERSNITKTVKGLTIPTCAMFIVAEMAGSGILALPKAIGEGGWAGLGLLLVCCSFSLYCGIKLGRCWIVARKTNAEYRGHVRDPYPLIGEAAAGKFGKYLVEFWFLLTVCGVCIVFLLLASHQISSLVDTKIGSFTEKNEFRIWILICGLALLPFTWLATPKDIWPFAVGASICTMLACVLIVARSAMVLYQYGIAPASTRKTPNVKSFFTAFGTIAFSFGGATLFPTFQSDMKNPKQFPIAASLAFTAVLFIYIPVTLLPYLAFGSNVNGNILQTLKEARGDGAALVICAEALITFHLLFTFVITINPIGQQIEEYLKMDHVFGWKRIFLRTSIVLFIIGVAEVIPNFFPIMSFIGGSTGTIMGFVLPCWFYLRLHTDVPLYIKIFHIVIVFVALLSGGAATYSAATNFTNPFKS